MVAMTQAKGLARVRAGACFTAESGDSVGPAPREIEAVPQEVFGRRIVVSGAVGVGAK